MSLEAGQELLHYRLVEKLGEGGMGVVWKALDTSLGREAAIKVLPPNFAADAERLARFDREARLLASLNHPHIAGIYGIHRAETAAGPLHFLAMELVAGEDLSQALERGALPIETALRVACEVATGLEAAHENGVIHRDLKPANVRLTPDGRAKVLDFGLATSYLLSSHQVSVPSPAVNDPVDADLGPQDLVEDQVLALDQHTVAEAPQSLVARHHPTLGEPLERLDGVEKLRDQTIGRARPVAANVAVDLYEVILSSAENPDRASHRLRNRLRIAGRPMPRSPALTSASAASRSP